MPTTTLNRATGPVRTLLARITGDLKHSPSAHSTLDVLWVLYDQILRITPDTVDSPDRDRFLLSKGHGPAAYYAVLAAKGFLPEQALDTMGAWESPLGYHPDRLRIPGVEISSGSLGHGLPIAVGMALGLRLPGPHASCGAPLRCAPRASGQAQDLTRPRVYVLVGDAELDEGSNHEAIAYAGAVGLDSITVVVIDNRSATHGWPGGIGSRFTVNGWSATTVDGRDHEAIAAGLRAGRAGKPHVVVARTESKG